MKKMKLFQKTYLFTVGLMAIIIIISHTLLYMLLPSFYTNKKQQDLDNISYQLTEQLQNNNSNKSDEIAKKFADMHNINILLSVNGKNKVYDSRNNCNAIIETATNTLIQGCSTTIIPNTVTRIKNNAFESCSSLTSIVIPNSITFIGYNIFKDCSSLKAVFYEGSVTNWNNVDKRYLGIENKYVAFYSETKPADNDYRYWHYVDNVPTLWNEK